MNITGKIVGSFYSKTMWAGLAIMVANWLDNNTRMFQDWFPEDYNNLVLYAVGVLVWVLRFVTKKPLEDKKPIKVQGEDDTLEMY